MEEGIILILFPVRPAVPRHNFFWAHMMAPAVGIFLRNRWPSLGKRIEKAHHLGIAKDKEKE